MRDTSSAARWGGGPRPDAPTPCRPAFFDGHGLRYVHRILSLRWVHGWPPGVQGDLVGEQLRGSGSLAVRRLQRTLERRSPRVGRLPRPATARPTRPRRPPTPAAIAPSTPRRATSPSSWRPWTCWRWR